MSKTTADILIYGIVGLMMATIPAILAAGAYCMWAMGAYPLDVEFWTILEFAPWTTGAAEPFQTGILVGVGLWLAGGLVTVVLGLKPALKSHGTAKWASLGDIKRAKLCAPLKAVQGPIYGKFGGPRSRAPYLTSTEIPHSLIAAPTGSGKGVGIVIPTLLTYNGSVVCLDVKGENFALTSRQREAMGDRVYKFSPYDEAGRTHRYNPVDIVSQADERRRYTEARRLASSLIIAKGKGAEGFLEDAREIFAAGVVFAIERGTPTIAAVYDLFSQHGKANANFETMAAEATAPEARSVFNRMAATEFRTLSAYLSVLNGGGLNLWADAAVRDATSVSDFTFEDLRSDPASIFIVVSPNDLGPLSAMIRLMFQQAVAITQRAMPGPKDKFPVLFLMDEFASLGRMDTLSNAITTLRGYGGRLMIVVQSLANLAEVYGHEGAANFLANCRLQLFMAPADAQTPEYVSRAVGDYTRKARSRSWQTDRLLSSNIQEREEGARLIRPEELRRLDQNTLVALVQNQDPVKTRKVRYYEDRGLKVLFEDQSGPLPEPPSLFTQEGRVPRALESRRVDSGFDTQSGEQSPVDQESREIPATARLQSEGSSSQRLPGVAERVQQDRETGRSGHSQFRQKIAKAREDLWSDDA